jgi:hypothetical protein
MRWGKGRKGMQQERKNGNAGRLEHSGKDAEEDVRHRILAMTRVLDGLAKDSLNTDRGYTGVDALGALREALLGIPAHPWYARRAHVLGPVMRACVAEWFVDLEAHTERDGQLPCLENSVADAVEACVSQWEEEALP